MIREQDPLKQGLKLLYLRKTIRRHISIREQDPLKQGLKRQISSFTLLYVLIREQDPLKQGLKPPNQLKI